MSERQSSISSDRGMCQAHGNFLPCRSCVQKADKYESIASNEYVNIPEEMGGGHVKLEAWKAYAEWENMAREANNGRSLFKKIFLIDKKIALDFARQEADAENKKINELQHLEHALI